MATLPAKEQVANPEVTNAQQKVLLGNLLDFSKNLFGSSDEKSLARGVLDVPSRSEAAWYGKAIGEVVALRDDLAGVSAPPTDNGNFRYIKLTASDAYNTGVLTGESISGSAPYITATAVISLTGSPINGQTINLLNTERRFLRAGSPGALEDDSFKSHTHTWSSTWGSNFAGGQTVAASTTAATAGSNQTRFTGTNANTGDTETKPRNQGVTLYMRIK